MAKKKAARKRTEKKQEVQAYIDPDMAPPSIPELDKAAFDYVNLRDERMSLTEDEVAARQKLLELMNANHLEEYKTPGGMVVKVTEIERKVKVRKATEDSDE